MHRLLGLLPVRALRRYLDASGPNWATIVAWNLFFAFFPMVILTVTVVGLVLRDPGTRSAIEQQVVSAFPSCRSPSGCAILSALDGFRHSTGALAAVGILGLVWSGMSLFGAMEQALNSVYGVATRGFVSQKVMSVGMVLLFTAMAVPLLVSGSLLSLLQSIPGLPGFLRSGPASLLIQLVAGILDASVLFGVIFYVVPNRRQRLRQVIPGALLTGVLFEGLTLAFPLYFKLVTNSPQWGQTFGFVFVLLFYFFLLGQLVLLGGSLNAELEGAPRSPEGVTSLSQRGNIAAPAS